jgi:hypothetical protein
MSFPSQSKDEHRNLKGRARSSSFNNSFIRRQQSDLFDSNLNSHIRRRPSFDSNQRHQQQQQQQKQQQYQIQSKASHGNFLAVSQHHSNGGASSIDESGSEENEDDSSIFHHRPVASISTHQFDTNKQFVGKVGFEDRDISIFYSNRVYIESPTPITPEEPNSSSRSLASSFKEKLNVSRKTARKGGTTIQSSGGVFGAILGSKSSSTTTTNSNQQLYDDGSNAIYPPPQKQTGKR